MSDKDGGPHVDAVKPISAADGACLGEIREVLARHNALTRFGVMLLHDHFEIADDEILVESCDPVSRTLVSRPIKKLELEGQPLLETNWSFADAPNPANTRLRYIKTCRAVCQPVRGQGHSRVHYPM